MAFMTETWWILFVGYFLGIMIIYLLNKHLNKKEAISLGVLFIFPPIALIILIGGIILYLLNKAKFAKIVSGNHIGIFISFLAANSLGSFMFLYVYYKAFSMFWNQNIILSLVIVFLLGISMVLVWGGFYKLYWYTLKKFNNKIWMWIFWGALIFLPILGEIIWRF
jgi:hypothetical protein